MELTFIQGSGYDRSGPIPVVEPPHQHWAQLGEIAQISLKLDLLVEGKILLILFSEVALLIVRSIFWMKC